MVDKAAYVEHFKQIHFEKVGVLLSDEEALESFESLISLVETITAHIDLGEIRFEHHG